MPAVVELASPGLQRVAQVGDTQGCLCRQRRKYRLLGYDVPYELAVLDAQRQRSAALVIPDAWGVDQLLDGLIFDEGISTTIFR